MLRKMMIWIGWAVLALPWIAGCSIDPVSPATTAGDEEIGMPNPASVYCEEQGGIVEMRAGADGQYGVCIFPDGSECDEWAFFNGACAPGGEKIGMPNPASVYCEEQGGIVEMRAGADGQYGVCIFPDGSECDEWAFFNGACAPGGEAVGDASTEVVVTGWLGHVISTSAGAQYDDYLVLANDAGTVGLSGTTPEIEVAIVALRDKEEPGKDAHFWGTLACDVPDYGGCQLRVTQVRVGATMTAAEPVAGWEGAVIANPPGAQFDDVFVLAGDYPMGFGLSARDLEDQIAALRDTGTIIKVWGVLRTGVPDAYGAQIEVTRFEIRD